LKQQNTKPRLDARERPIGNGSLVVIDLIAVGEIAVGEKDDIFRID
jgi:hypothetical protein